MAYTINRTNGSVLTTVADGTVDNTSDITLVGKNYSGYGEILNENLIKILENFSSTSQPAAPLSGQLWWDVTNGVLKIYNGTSFKIISGSTASSAQPTGSTIGDLWFDTVNQQLRVYNGTTWTLIGPSFTAGTGVSGSVVTTILDSVGSSHVIVEYIVNESIVAILSKDSQFTPQTTITGFSTISPGFQLSTTVSGAQFIGTATDSDTIETLTSSQFLRSDANDSTTGTLLVANDSGLTVGADSDAKINVSGSDVYFNNNTSDGDIYIRINKSTGGVTSALTIDGATGYVTATTPTAGDNSTKIATTAYVDSTSTGFVKVDGSVSMTGSLLPNANATLDLGSSSFRYADVYAVNLNGLAISALYADLAERFEADSYYDAGTVVELGGPEEITAVVEELSDKVFGVISENAGYLMNSSAGTNETHPPVAMTGRVKVKVTGIVHRGDRLVSAGSGMARAAQPDEATSFNVIGRSLEDKFNTDAGTVLAVVKVQ